MDDALQQGIAAFRAGKRDEARNLIITAVKQDPHSERAWEWFYNVADNNEERITSLRQILRIDPQNEKAKQLLDALNNPAPPPFQPEESPTTDPSAVSQPGNAAPAPAVETDKDIQVKEKTAIKWQYITFFSGMALCILVLFIPFNLLDHQKYIGLIFAAACAYIGISSIVNRISIIKIRGQQGHSKGNKAILFGILALFIAIVNVGILFAPPLLNTLGRLTTPTPAIPAQEGFSTVFVINENASNASSEYRVMQFVGWVMLATGIIACIGVGVYSMRRRQWPRYAPGFMLLTVIGLAWLNFSDQTKGSLAQDCAHLQSLYDSQQYEILEGPVHILHAQPAGGHAPGDTIEVDNFQLVVNYFSATCGYKTTIAYGGSLTENVHARIYYADSGEILRIDLRNK